MPHLTLEYTANVAPATDLRRLFSRLHHVLAGVGGISIANFKSRAIRLDDYHVGDGSAENAFVHLEIRLLEGRAAELKRDIGRQSLRLLHEHFAPAAEALALQITVDFRDIAPQTYLKLPEGTL
jgi:5-carboxymethyl-2-hydroxymuconate isomerase